MRNRAPSLRWLIGGVYFFIMMCILGALAIFISHSIEKQYVDTKLHIIEGQATLGADILSPLIYARHEELQTTLLNIYQRTNACRVTLLEVPGTSIIMDRPIGSSNYSTDIREEVREALLTGGTGTARRYDPMEETELLFIAVPVQMLQHKLAAMRPDIDKPPYPTMPNAKFAPQGEENKIMAVWAILVLAVPFDEIRDTVNLIRIAIALAFAGVLLIVLVINASVSSFISRPLATLSDAAMRFSHGELNEYVDPAGAAEIMSLGDSFNRMAEQLRLTIFRLREERAQAEAILASMVDGVLVTDTDGRILMMNRAATPYCCPGQESVTGQPLSEVIPNADLQNLLANTLAMNMPLKHEMTFETPQTHIVEVHLAPVVIEGRPVGVVIVLYDVTHQRKIEEVQRDFVANVSHELRTPVTSIRALAETLLDADGAEPEMRQDFLTTIADESERLTALLDSLLKLAHIEHDQRMITPEPTDLIEVIRDVVQRMAPTIAAKRQRLVVETPDALHLIADRHAMMQILINLLENARKYTPEGGAITLRAEGGDTVRVQVCDTGIGIPHDERDRIFERFYRVDRARTRTQGGTGLGLAIVKHLVEMHEGCILVESEVGAGSCFTIIFPQPPLEQATPGEEGELPTGVVSRSSGDTRSARRL